MERLQERINTAEKAMQRFEEAMAIENPSSLERDAGIQRFEFTFEALWKAARSFLYELEGFDVGSPKGVVRACREVGVLDEEQTVCALQMADDRNLTVHTYNEALAVEIHSRLSHYVPLMRYWLEEMRKKTDALINDARA